MERTARILIVEDQPAVAQALSLLFELNELACSVARTPAEALAVFEREPIGVVVQDMNFTPNATSGEEGIALFRALRARDPDLPILLLTAWSSLETAVTLVKEGASDYLKKPWDDERLVATVRDLLRVRRERARDEVDEDDEHELRHADLRGLVCRSPRMRRLVALALRVARSDVGVLITGANGTGKEKLAEVIQANSTRKERPFVKVNVGGIPDTLLESELFGNEPGAFTGASARRIGRFEAADGGTLLLDEIANLSESGQRRLLRVLQEGEFERLGSNTTRRVDVRVIGATNADLDAEMAAGRFRRDLFFRLNVVELSLPLLADRREDVLPLARTFLAEADSVAGTGRQLSSEAEHALEDHSWPGNVRELSNRIRRALLVARADVLGPADLGLLDASSEHAGWREAGAREDGHGHPAGSADAEREALEAVLERADGVVAHAAAELGISRQAFYRRMSRLGIELERRPKR